MTAIDILFWLLVAMMGGIAWAVEAGLGYRHRKVLSSSVLAAFGAGIIIMFWIDDNTFIDYKKAGPAEKQKKKASDHGMLEQVETEKDGAQKSGGGGGGGSPAASNGASEGEGSKSNASNSGAAASSAASKAEGAKGDRAGSAAAAAPKPNDEITIDESKAAYSATPFKDCPECPDIVIIPQGETTVGSPANEKGRGPDEQLPTPVAFDKSFAIGRLEILRGEFAAFAADTGYETTTQCDLGKRRGRFTWKTPGIEQDERHAVTCVTAEDVSRYLDWLSNKSGRTYRLPTEQEWEYAARSQTNTPYWTGDAILSHQGNFGRSRDGTTVSGSFEMNNFGLSDVAGNLWEMTSGCFRRTPANPEDKACHRIVKGGGWNSPVETTRHAARSKQIDGVATNFVGFRVARMLDARDNDKLLTKEQQITLIRESKLAAEFKAKEIADIEKAKFDAREAAVKAAEKAAEEAAAKVKAAEEAAAKAKAAKPPVKK